MTRGAHGLTAKERVGRGLDLLARGLRPFVDQQMGAASPGKDWVKLLETRDELRTGRARQYSADNPRFLLRVLTEERRVFGDVLSRANLALASELREVGNGWAHEPAMTDDDAHRALDTMERLLTAVGASEIAAEVRAIRLGAATEPEPMQAEASPSLGTVAPDEPAPSLGIATIQDDTIEAELAFSPAVNYALVHNGLSPLRSLAINNPRQVPLAITSVEVRLEAPLADVVAPALTFPGFELAANEAAQVPTGALRWAMNPVAFARLEEAVGAQLHLIVNTSSGRFHAEQSILLLARDEWWATAIPESLAAFIAPRDRAIGPLLDEASALLQTRTGDPSLPGYQAGSERVLDIAQAVYDAMRAREIRYINPPPSYEGTGQKIRAHREVLDDRWGTCLDLTCAYAAALEAAGLNPVTVMCDGHAFAGVLVDDMQLPEVALTDPNTIVNLIDSRMLVTVETTAIATGPNSLDFADAQRATSPWFTHRLGQIENLLDVRRAHRRVRPMPSVSTDGPGVSVDVERRADRPMPLPRIGPRPDTSTPTAGAGERVAQDFPPRIAKWRNSLLDLSFRNPLLNMRTGRSGLDLHIPAGSLATLEDMVAAGHILTLLPNDELDDIHRAAGARTAQDIEADQLADLLTGESILFTSCTQAAYPTRLKGLVRKAHTVIEETGANNLFLALGSLLWDDAGREARAPLFLVPVTLKARRGRPFQLQIEDGGYAIPNQCLLEKLRISKGLVVPSFETPELDESGIDLADSLQQIRVALVQANLRYRVEETAHLAILQFSTLQLWQDLSENWPSFLTANPVVRHMVETPTDTFVDAVAEPAASALAEAEAYLPIAVDGSQLEAVRWAAAGRSFVLEGPPGTGKSQTITNLIANSLAEGRRVLFVAEKQAALDVVRRGRAVDTPRRLLRPLDGRGTLEELGGAPDPRPRCVPPPRRSTCNSTRTAPLSTGSWPTAGRT